MGSNRRENIKKTLGLTEYPWSSDDEDNPQNTSEAVSTTRRQADTTNSNLPGPSGSVHSPRRRNRVRVERELYWSLLNNPPRPPPTEAAPGPSRPISSSSGATESIDLTSPMTNLQRIFAIRKLRNNHTSNSHFVHPALQRSASSPRISGQGSSAPTTWAEQASLRANRRLNTTTARIKKALAIRASSQPFFLRPPSSARPDASSRSPTRSPPRSPPRSTPRSPPRSTPRSPPTDSAPSDDADDIPFSPPPAAADPTHNDAEERDPHEDQVDVRSPGLLFGPAGDAPRGTPAASEDAARAAGDPMELDEDESENPPADDGSNQEEAAEGAAAAASRLNVNRKRPASAQLENVTVEDLNRSLLQLLECPVCLEWMDPPMSQCRRGHLVCVRCRARLSACPVCRTAFSSMRNRAMEGVAEKLHYPCRHGCGRETQLRQRSAHEASCPSRCYRCPAAACTKRELLPLGDMPHHFQTSHASMLRVGSKHEFSMKMNVDQHDDWLLMAGRDLFYMRVDVNIRTWGIVVHVAYIGPKCKANTFTYEVSVMGLHKERRLVYRRETHSDLESASLNVSRQDCFHLTLDQALNFLRYRNRHSELDKFLEFSVEIAKREPPAREPRDDPDS